MYRDMKGIPVILIIESNSIFQEVQFLHLFLVTIFISFLTKSLTLDIFLESYLFQNKI